MQLSANQWVELRTDWLNDSDGLGTSWLNQAHCFKLAVQIIIRIVTLETTHWITVHKRKHNKNVAHKYHKVLFDICCDSCIYEVEIFSDFD